MIVILLGTFLMNFLPAFVLFDSGVSRSFVSTSFSRGFSVPCEPVDRPLRVAIPDKNTIRLLMFTELCTGDLWC